MAYIFLIFITANISNICHISNIRHNSLERHFYFKHYFAYFICLQYAEVCIWDYITFIFWSYAELTFRKIFPEIFKKFQMASYFWIEENQLPSLRWNTVGLHMTFWILILECAIKTHIFTWETFFSEKH